MAHIQGDDGDADNHRPFVARKQPLANRGTHVTLGGIQLAETTAYTSTTHPPKGVGAE